ncbi:methyltransferase domain-containing protein [Dactylosporangium aurantiacum]|uniref:Methyltransferase domain-containing protein n=1 Tax=Dactylosporangium aurantiacum TaxID=35754 RepID=A0A9Q9IFZ0_9ACTN|nr:methyltransferase domain-containing protein [Dactylosporangium aurantiacum]MDG6109382.1 methyltransferase domain-containing protein [Dactylosporangium aurantiacum]UWZ55484.1 methyltransferase domain-containing protein [Dactylosporangium aurantiacum]
MHPSVITHLRCPVCAGALTDAGRVLRCAAGHSFDVARQGYVDLTVGRGVHTGDSADMVAARESLLDAGHFDLVSDAVAEAAAGVPGAGLILEVGAGTGRYLARALGPHRVGLAVDVSKPALRRAARIDPRVGAVRADVWQGLPVRDATADVVLDIFAPRSGAEFARVLRPGGAVVVVTPAPGHLAELVAALGMVGVDPAKEERLAASLRPWLTPAGSVPLRATLSLDRAAAAALVGMGPSAWHTDPEKVAATLAGMPEPITATLAVRLSVWRSG